MAKKKRAIDAVADDRILWEDRKRWLGLPLTFTKYIVDENRLYIKTGFFKTEVNEVLLYRILDINSSRTLGQKILGVGTVTLFCSDKTNPTTELKNIKHSDKVHKFLSNIIETRRNERGITGRELIGSGAVPNHLYRTDANEQFEEMFQNAPPPPMADFCDHDGDGIPD